MKKAYVHVIGCERRLLDASKIRKYFEKNNWEITKKPQDAQIIVLVTCGVVNSITEISLNKVKELKKYDAELIVAGCIPELDKEKLSKIFNGKTIVTKNLEKIDDYFPEHKVKFSEISDAEKLFENEDFRKNIGQIKKFFKNFTILENNYLNLHNLIVNKIFNAADDHSIYYRYLTKKSLCYIRTSWGCRGNCSYCTVRYATGPLKSKSFDTCIEEFKNGLNSGYTDFILIADDIGAYGLDIGKTFPDLLKELVKNPGEYKISIRDLNPRWLLRYSDELSEILKSGKIVSIDLPIQSGSEKILGLMHRYNNIEKLKELFIKIKNSHPNTSFNTHIIVGFPSETMDDFKQSMDFITDVGINSGLVFPFSLKDGAEAEKIEPKISREEIKNRIKYAKNYLKKNNFKVYFKPKLNVFIFEKK